MPKITYPQGICIKVETTLNSITVTGHPSGSHEESDDVSYSFNDIKKASRELPAIFSVLMDKSGDVPKNEKELDKLEKDTNEAAKGEKY